jgi:hypothetical protein
MSRRSRRKAAAPVLRWACIDPCCPEVTELHVIRGAHGPEPERLAELLGEFIPCNRCGGICRRFEKHPSEVEGQPGGAA